MKNQSEIDLTGKTKYAYSLKTTRIEEKDFPYSTENFSCTSDVLSFVRSLQDADVEKMLILYLDAHNKLICLQIMSGTLNQCVVYPREVFKHALLAGAAALILIHNHPSGLPKPSDADITLTKTLKEVGAHLNLIIHDHLIIGKACHFSFREEGLMT